jgi:glycerol 3-phosphatase-2
MTDTLASSYDLILFDLDGVVYLGTEAVPEAVDAIRSIVEAGAAVGYVTNNASRRAHEVATLLRSLGLPARDEEVVTSGAAAAKMLAEDLPAGAPVLVVGSSSLRDELRAVGLRPVESADDKPVAVIQGYGPTVGWSDLAEGCLALRAGARWMATNTDATMPSGRGPLPGNGSMVAALSTALGGRRPDVVVGKPEPALLRVAAENLGGGRVLMVGDRLDTDMEGANRAGMDSLLVFTGVSTAEDALRATERDRPTHIAADLRGLSTREEDTRVPDWPASGPLSVGRWQVSYISGDLSLTSQSGTGGLNAIDAVRALAAAAWAHPGWTGLHAADPEAERVLDQLGLRPATANAGGAPT